MCSKRATYLPITSIVIGIVLLASAVAFVSYRDIGRGREQLSEILWYQARGILAFTSADLSRISSSYFALIPVRMPMPKSSATVPARAWSETSPPDY